MLLRNAKRSLILLVLAAAVLFTVPGGLVATAPAGSSAPGSASTGWAWDRGTVDGWSW